MGDHFVITVEEYIRQFTDQMSIMSFRYRTTSVVSFRNNHDDTTSHAFKDLHRIMRGQYRHHTKHGDELNKLVRMLCGAEQETTTVHITVCMLCSVNRKNFHHMKNSGSDNAQHVVICGVTIHARCAL